MRYAAEHGTLTPEVEAPTLGEFWERSFSRAPSYHALSSGDRRAVQAALRSRPAGRSRERTPRCDRGSRVARASGARHRGRARTRVRNLPALADRDAGGVRCLEVMSSDASAPAASTEGEEASGRSAARGGAAPARGKPRVAAGGDCAGGLRQPAQRGGPGPSGDGRRLQRARRQHPQGVLRGRGRLPQVGRRTRPTARRAAPGHPGEARHGQEAR